VATAQGRFGGGRGSRGAGSIWGEDDGSGGTWGEGGWISGDARTPREIQSHSTGSPIWTNPIAFEKRCVLLRAVRRARNPNSYGANWATDTPDSDLNLSFRCSR